MKHLLFILLACLVLGGCVPPENTPAKPHSAEPAYDTPEGRVISLSELADRLGLTILRQSEHLARLQRGDRQITVLASPEGQILIDGRVILRSGHILPTDRMLYVPEACAPMLREALDDADYQAAPRVAERADNEVPPQAEPRRVDVVIDAGHGGQDPGAIGYRRLLEKELNLEVALLLAGRLRRAGLGVELTRQEDVFVDLDRRVEQANRSRARLFVSLHGDASRNRSARGATVFVPRRNGPGSASHRAGAAIDRALREVVLHTRGVRQHEVNLRVLEKTTVPAVLVELGFLTTPSEAAYLARADYRRRLAEALAEGVLRYIKER